MNESALSMQPTILLVEDNSSDEKLTLHAFNRCGIAGGIVVVRDGAEALDFLAGTGRHAGREMDLLPAVVLLDLQLPRVSGLEVLRRIRATEHTKLLPVVMLSSSAEAKDVERSLSLGANAYVRKPVNFSEFLVAATALGMFWLQVNQRIVRGASIQGAGQ